MSLGTPAAVVLAILFVIPGFIWRKMAQVASPYAPTGKIELLECLALSCVNYLLAFLPIYLLLYWWPDGLNVRKPETVLEHLPYVGLWLLPVFVLPVFGGIVLTKLSTHEKVKSFLGRFGISILHPAPTAWDYTFARNEKYWARIEFSDGSRVEGLFDSNSLASSRPGERDIFLETVYELDEESGQYEPLTRNAGILVRGDSIRTITFFKTDEDTHQETQVTSQND